MSWIIIELMNLSIKLIAGQATNSKQIYTFVILLKRSASKKVQGYMKNHVSDGKLLGKISNKKWAGPG